MQARSQGVKPHVLERLEAVRADARTARLRARILRAASATVVHDAERTVQATLADWQEIVDRRVPLFVISGELDEDEVQARWVPGVGLLCPPRLRQRGEIVVEMGEMFSATPDGRTFVAALDASREALYTLMRAMSRVRSVEMVPSLLDGSRPWLHRAWSSPGPD